MSTDVFRSVILADHIARCHGGTLDDARLHIAAPDYASAASIASALVEELGGTVASHHRYVDAFGSDGGSFQLFDRRAFELATVAYHGPEGRVADDLAAKCWPCLLFPEDCRVDSRTCDGPRTTVSAGGAS